MRANISEGQRGMQCGAYHHGLRIEGEEQQSTQNMGGNGDETSSFVCSFCSG